MLALPIYQDLFLIGGGHAHVQVLNMWAMQPIPGVRLTLISPQAKTPYSGMLPGLIAGHYQEDDIHIDLARLCQYASARFIQAEVERVDLENKQCVIKKRAALGFDAISFNTGITPGFSVPGAGKNSVPVKPIAQFYPRWQKIRKRLLTSNISCNIGVAGGGAAGIELVLAMQHALKNSAQTHQFHLFQKGLGLPDNYPPVFQKKLSAVFKSRGIQVHKGSAITQIDETSSAEGERNLQVHLSNGQDKLGIEFSELFWCTQAAAPAWPKKSGLACDADGFIQVNHALQSTSHKFVFAAGDIAQQEHENIPRAGVFAVRQASTLFKNLQAWLLHKPLRTFKPQAHFLRLLACGDQSAIACKPGTGMPSLQGRWVWRWKNSIDQKFIAMFEHRAKPIMPKLGASASSAQTVSPIISGEQIDQQANDDNTMRCGGCGAKVGADVLSRVISQLQPFERSDVLLGLHTPDDASAIAVAPGNVLLQSVDVFRALIDDPFLLGEIAVNHALSDLFAMNAQAHSALAIVTLPFAGEAIVERDLFQIMSGALKVLNDNQCTLMGGHTSEGAEMSLGFSVNGLAKPEQISRKNTPRVGDKLILTKALGTGVLFAAHNQLQADGKWIEEAINSMLQSNRVSAEILHKHSLSACTDVTGFGLAGHLLEMLAQNKSKRSIRGARIELGQLPLLSGAIQCLAKGMSSTLHTQNARNEEKFILTNHEQKDARWLRDLLFDPQTSGGLLAAVSPDEALNCLRELKQSGYQSAAIIGEIVEGENIQVELI